MAELVVNPNVNADLAVRLCKGGGIWITVTDDDTGDAKVVRLGVDLPTGCLKISTFDPGKEDEVPNSEILENFS